MTTKSELKEFFESGDQPTQDHFGMMIDECYNEVGLTIPEGNNYFNINDPGVAIGSFVNQSSGSLNSNTSHNATHFIEVLGGENYFVSRVNRYAWYDSDQTYISGVSSTQTNVILTAPANAVYIRLSLDETTNAWPVLMVTRALSASVYPFKVWDGQEGIDSALLPGITQNTAAIESAKSRISSVESLTEGVIIASRNLFNVDDPDVTEGRFVNTTNGQLNVSSAHNASHFIAVNPADDLYISNAERYVWYDATQTIVEGFDLNRGEKQLVVPDGVSFVRFSVDRSLNNVIVAVSPSAVAFEPFGSRVSDSQAGENFTGLLKLLANYGNRLGWVLPTNVLYIGDSLSNGSADIAARSIFHSGIDGNFSRSVAGSRLDQIPSVLSGFDTDPFDTIVIGRLTNDVAGGASFSTIQTRIMTAIGWFPDKQLVVMNCPPLNNLASYGPVMQRVIDDINDWLDTLWDDESSRRVFDLNGTWDSNGDDQLDPEFVAAADDIHPNDDGYDAGGEGLAQILTSV